MTTLVNTKLLTYENGRSEIYAIWQDEIGTFAAIHDTDGRAAVKPEGTNPPQLTADQIAAALTPPAHPAYALAAKGKAAKPAWANRYDKAAALVESGAVRLTGPETAVVTGGSGEYQLSNKECGCDWAKYHTSDDPCSHYIAVRMARSLGQAIDPQDDAEKEAKARDRVEAEEAQVYRRVANGRYQMEQEKRRSYRDGDGARRWISSFAAHNPGQAIPTALYQRATGYGREDELARAKAEALASIAAKGPINPRQERR